MAGTEITIGSRGSQLALWQSGHVRSRLEARYSGLKVGIKIIKTLGDRVLDVALSKVGDKGLFTREIESAILAGEVDFAVHSLKDMPTETPPGLVLGIITERVWPEDALVSRSGLDLSGLPARARVGTSSLRRRVQLIGLRPDLEYIDIRGNVDTRLAKLERGEYEAIVLARAGLTRLGLQDKITQILGPEIMVPAAGQGALALEYREGDSLTAERLTFLADPATTSEVTAERDFLNALGGGCQVPIGARASLVADGFLSVLGFLSDLEGRHLMRDSLVGRPEDRPGLALARRMLAAGGQKIVDEIRASLESGKGAVRDEP